MKILYGVQTTGNGHITRARVMAPALAQEGIEVDFLFSGRPPEKLFNMEPFGDYQTHRGLTFTVTDGKIDRWRSLTQNNLIQLIKDIKALDLQQYDLIISDFEPVTAWAAKLQKKPCIGIAHQYAFSYPLPGPSIGRVMMPMIRFFAPVQQGIGLHWHHFDGPILPPLIEAQPYPITVQSGMILVYLPFENREQIRQWLLPFSDHEQLLARCYKAISSEPPRAEEVLVLQRPIPVRAVSANCIWFDFEQLCMGARSQMDYIDLANRFSHIFVSQVPLLGSRSREQIKARGTEDGSEAVKAGERQVLLGSMDDPARRFISLVDELYDRGVNLFLSVEVPLEQLYMEGSLIFEFARTFSRLTEMQSLEYQQRPPID